MCKKVITATVLGGVSVFVWGMISWMLLPWHKTTFNEFKDESAVVQTISENVDKTGIYLRPYTNDFTGAAKAEFDEKYKAGPRLFVIYTKEGGDPTMKPQMIMGFLTQLAAAFLISLLLWSASGLSYGGRVLFVTGAGLLTGILGYMPSYIWWNFPLDFVLVGIADQIIAWFIAGLLMAKIIRP